MDVKGKKVLVFGSGISGESAARLLLRQGAGVILYDGNEKLDSRAVEKKITDSAQDGADMPAADLEIVLGAFPEEMLGELSLAVLSPGVPADLPVVE